MVLVRITYLYCDGESVDCETSDGAVDNSIHPKTTGTEQREFYRKKGWIRKNGKDLCPACQASAATTESRGAE